MKNDFRKTDRLAVVFSTAQEREELIRTLDEKEIRVCGSLRGQTEIPTKEFRTVFVRPRARSTSLGVEPFIGAAMISTGVRFYSVREFIRLAELDFRVVPRFPVFHIPRAGDRLPLALMPSVSVPEQEFRRRHELARDREARRLVPEAYYGGEMVACFELSPLLCDPEAPAGPGETAFCPDTAPDGTRLRNVTEETLSLTRTCYDAHRTDLDARCARHPRILLITLKTFSAETLPADVRRKDHLPRVCMGTDPDSTPRELERRIAARLREADLPFAVNDPFSGTFIPGAARRGADVIAVTLAFDRGLFHHEDGTPSEERAEQLRALVDRIVTDCADL